MNKLMIAVAATIALPAAALAQTTPDAVSPAAHAAQGAQVTDCKDVQAAMSGPHSGHQTSGSSAHADHSKMDHSRVDYSKMAGARAGHAAAAGGQPCHHMAKPTAAAKAAAGHQQHQH